MVLLVGCSSDTEPAASPGVSGKRIGDLQADLDRMVAAGVTGALATVTENGETVVVSSGVADRDARTPIPTDSPQQVRVGSINKTFTSAVLLQLVAEGRLRLDEPVDTYLPGLLTGAGIDGRVITVRQILRHQSGLPDFAADSRADEYQLALAHRTLTPAESVAIALSAPAEFAPGERYEYSNTNYTVAGLLIEKVTGATYAEELNRRILKPLALKDTYLPAPGELEIRGPHPKGYAEIDGTITDVTRIEPSVPWAGGALVSSGADLNRFYSALLAGNVVPAPQLREMRDGVVVDPATHRTYGLGLEEVQLPCGADYIRHTGGIYGFVSVSGATSDNRQVTFTFTLMPETVPDIDAMLGRALCP